MRSLMPGLAAQRSSVGKAAAAARTLASICTAGWKFEEADDAASYVDSKTGNANPLTPNGSALASRTRIAAQVGNGLRATCTLVNNMELDGPGVLGGGSAWSLAGWVRRSTTAAPMTFSRLGGDANSFASFISGFVTMRVMWNGTDKRDYPSAINAITFTHFAIVYDAAGGPSLTYYENGSVVSPSASQGSLPNPWPSGADAWRIFAASASGTRTADFDSLWMFSAALTAAEVASLAAGTEPF